ncbi:MAG TPA: alpha/beta hydrolase [Beijerinckiaceae bacterium]|nr:alpha/beta hydrolase [Beijerinckiaceae bacterium]
MRKPAILPPVMASRARSRSFLAFLAWSGLSAAQAPPSPDPALEAYARPQRLVEVERGRRLHLYCLGKGSPTVVLTAGLGQWSVAWSPVHSQIARIARTCSWDRAGFGFSDPSDDPQTLKQTTGDLERLLKRAAGRGPYVLVGHSYGGFESLLFADRHPRSVAGMVLVDSTVPDQSNMQRRAAPAVRRFFDRFEADYLAFLRRCEADVRNGKLGADATDPDHCFDYPASWPDGLKAAIRRLDSDPRRRATARSLIEHSSSGDSDRAAVNPARHYGRMPLIVLTAGVHRPLPDAPAEILADYPRIFEAWDRSHDALATLSERGVNRFVAGAGHSIQREKPEAVVAAVREVIEVARAERRR